MKLRPIRQRETGFLGLGRGGNLIMALLGFFALIFALWTLVVDTNATYNTNTTEYNKTFNVLQTQGDELVNISEEFKNKIVEDEDWQAKDYMIVGTGMINLILQLLFSIGPIMLAIIAAIQEVTLNLGIASYFVALLVAGIIFYVAMIIISMFRGKDY